jgi:hypothetical protein
MLLLPHGLDKESVAAQRVMKNQSWPYFTSILLILAMKEDTQRKSGEKLCLRFISPLSASSKPALNRVKRDA